jgi:hypothetical protein
LKINIVMPAAMNGRCTVDEGGRRLVGTVLLPRHFGLQQKSYTIGDFSMFFLAAIENR